VFQTTLTAWAFVDPLLFFLCFKATESWPAESRKIALIAVGIWIFFFAKCVKLLGHFIRYPGDFVMLPISILFGYLHGILKLAGLFTLHEVP
jgi:hypothetical protein